MIRLAALSVVGAVALVLAVPGHGDEAEPYVSLDALPADFQSLGERCPVRVELPLPELRKGGPAKVVGALARYVHCQGVRISHLEVGAAKGPLDLVELSASAWVIAPQGRDGTAELEYELVAADGETYELRQFLELDEGEINWGHGGMLRVPGTVDLSSLRLRVTMTTPAPLGGAEPPAEADAPAPAAAPAAAMAEPSDPHATDRETILAASREFSRAYVAGDSAAVAALYTEDGLLMPPNRDVRGREAIERYFSTPPDRRPADHGMESSELRIVGDVATDVGRWWLQAEEGGPKVSERYLLVWFRQEDGSWKIAYDVWHRPQD